MKVKICGITCESDVEIINELKPDFAGFVMFFPKSKRSISPETAKLLLSGLSSDITSVAVTVSPTEEQVKTAAECGFGLIQVHGKTTPEILSNPYLKVLRAFNVNNADEFDKCRDIPNVVGYVFDAQEPGSGKTFDWSTVSALPRDGRLFMLAGGLNPENARRAALAVRPDGLDVSSGVENSDGNGKDRDKVKAFIAAARNADLLKKKVDNSQPCDV